MLVSLHDLHELHGETLVPLILLAVSASWRERSRLGTRLAVDGGFLKELAGSLVRVPSGLGEAVAEVLP